MSAPGQVAAVVGPETPPEAIAALERAGVRVVRNAEELVPKGTEPLVLGSPTLGNLEVTWATPEAVAKASGPLIGADSTLAWADSTAPAPSRHQRRVKRNDLCPCGRGRKVKRCCGVERYR